MLLRSGEHGANKRHCQPMNQFILLFISRSETPKKGLERHRDEVGPFSVY